MSHWDLRVSLYILYMCLLVSMVACTTFDDRRCYRPSVWELGKEPKAQADMKIESRPEVVGFSEEDCSFPAMFSGLKCWWNRCAKWGGEEEKATGRRQDSGGRLRRILSESLFGQEKAIDMIVSAFRGKSSDTPLSMHLVGDNGTGKTLASTLISKAVFRAENPDGLLYIRGNSYLSSEALATANFRKEIKTLVENQLRKCPNSIIVVDELQALHRNTIVVFDQFLDTTFRADYLENGGVETKDATFIFISDYGKEGTSIHDTPEELIERAYKESLSTWQGSRTSSLIQTIVPFLPASQPGAHELIVHLTYELFHLPYFRKNHLHLTGINFCTEDQLTTGIEKLIWENLTTGIHKLEQYRGIRKLFDQLITRPIVSSVSTFYEKNKLWEINRSEPPVDFSLLLCSNAGSHPLSVTTVQPWCTHKSNKPKEEL